jgi:hypothetical protein
MKGDVQKQLAKFWIDASKELPPSFVLVLGWVPGHQWRHVFREGTCWRMYSQREECTVTHWMPMPEAPTVEER